MQKETKALATAIENLIVAILGASTPVILNPEPIAAPVNVTPAAPVIIAPVVPAAPAQRRYRAGVRSSHSCRDPVRR